MSCYFRHLNSLFDEAGVRVTPDNKRILDQTIHAFVHVPYKRCMPDCWSKVKALIQDPTRRMALLSAIKRVC